MLSSFLSLGTTAPLSGAGVIVDFGSGVYCCKDGKYMNPDYRYATAFDSELRDLQHTTS